MVICYCTPEWDLAIFSPLKTLPFTWKETIEVACLFQMMTVLSYFPHTYRFVNWVNQLRYSSRASWVEHHGTATNESFNSSFFGFQIVQLIIFAGTILFDLCCSRAEQKTDATDAVWEKWDFIVVDVVEPIKSEYLRRLIGHIGLQCAGFGYLGAYWWVMKFLLLEIILIKSTWLPNQRKCRKLSCSPLSLSTKDTQVCGRICSWEEWWF